MCTVPIFSFGKPKNIFGEIEKVGFPAMSPIDN